MLRRGDSNNPGTLVISLDFELHWGIRDQVSIARYRDNLLGVRQAIPALLDLFTRYDIHATWATVGLLFFESREELLRGLPSRIPRYADANLSPYPIVSSIGESEADDPFHFAPSLLRLIADTPGQEIGTHTFCHYYCEEDGQTADDFRADLDAACRVATRYGVQLRSIVFPRNQVNGEYLAVCREFGLAAYRGNASCEFWKGSTVREESGWKRMLRLADSYLPIAPTLSYQLSPDEACKPVNVRASRFLRPYSPRLWRFEPLRLRRIKNELSYAAERGEIYHLWWHPHNFGANLEENVTFLELVLQHFNSLRDKFEMTSRSMGEVAETRAPNIAETVAIGAAR